MSYNGPEHLGTIKAKEPSDKLTISLEPPKWLKTICTRTGRIVKNWFKDDDIYSLFFKFLGVATLSPLIGFITLLVYTIPIPAILCTLLLVIVLLGVVGFAVMDSCPSAKQMFWIWTGVTVSWYVASLFGILEIYAVRALLV